jgi:hypothetical protein
MFMIVASQTDHVQISPDHPHVILQYEAFVNAGSRFVRLNPDRVYVEEVQEAPAAVAVDNEAFMPLDRAGMLAVLEPGDSRSDHFNRVTVAAAGACELADRTYTGNLDIQLDQVATTSEYGRHLAHDRLHLNIYPNPFRARTRITFTLEQPEEIELHIYDLLGRVVATPWERQMTAGIHEIDFDATRLPTGIYFCQLKAGQYAITRTIVAMGD